MAGLFLLDLFAPYEEQRGFCEIRTLRKGHAKPGFFPLPLKGESLREVVKYCLSHDASGYDVYVGVLPREEKSGKAAKITQAAWLWADLDTKNMDDDAIETVCAKGDMIVSSGHGRHVYWRTEETMRLDSPPRQKAFQRALRTFQVDTAGEQSDNTADLPRILRVPGTHNHKEPLPRPVLLVKRASALPDPLTRFKLRLAQRAAENQLPRLLGFDPNVAVRGMMQRESMAAAGTILPEALLHADTATWEKLRTLTL